MSRKSPHLTGPHLFTVPSSAPFLSVLADALLDGRLIEGFAPQGNPLLLATATVFLPTRRAGRLFGEALRARMPGGTTLLPRIVPLGDVDEDALAFAEAFTDPPRAVPPTTRRLALANLVGRWR
ncbi:MAG TPA: double-strand break repair protein AddB, partial [Ancylobacter sp.]